MRSSLKLGVSICFWAALFLVGCSHSDKVILPQSNHSGYVQVDKGKLFYQKFGSGVPVVVLHGGPGLDQNYLLPQMLELAKDYEVIFYDQRGSGKSLETEINSSLINLDQFTKDLEILRKHLGLKKFILLSHSVGGLLAMNYSVTYPDQVSALILLNTSPANFKGQQAFLDEFVKRTQLIKNQITPLFNYQDFEKLKSSEISELYRKLFSVYVYDPKDAAAITLNISEVSARSGFKVREEMSKTSGSKPHINLFPQLKKLNVPTLIVHGNEDIVPLWTAQEIKEAIPNAQIVSLEECGHFPYIEKPDQFFFLLRRFLSKSS